MRSIVLRVALAASLLALAGCAKYPVVSSPSASVPSAPAPTASR